MECVRNHIRLSQDQRIHNYLKSLDLQHSKYVTNVLSEVPYYTIVSKEEEEICDTGTPENQLLSFVKSIVVESE